MRGGQEKMIDYKKYLDKQHENPEFSAEWERQRPEREYIKAIIATRMEQNLTQSELAKKPGIRL